MKKLKEGVYATMLFLAVISCGAVEVMALYSQPVLALSMVALTIIFLIWYVRTSNKYDAFGIGSYLLLFITVMIWFQPQNETLFATPTHNSGFVVMLIYTIIHMLTMISWTFKKVAKATTYETRLLSGNLIFTCMISGIWLGGLMRVELNSSTLIANALLFSYIPVLTCTCIDLD